MRMMTAVAHHTLFRLATTLAVIVVMVAAVSSLAHAQQPDDSSTPLADLSIASEYVFGSVVRWVVTVENNALGVRPGMEFTLVKVRIVISDAIGGERTSVWTIRNLRPGANAENTISSLRTIPADPTAVPEEVAQRLYAEIIEADPVEAPGFQFNNATEHWALVNRRTGVNSFTFADPAVTVASISDRFPQAGRATTFNVLASNPTPPDSRAAFDRQESRLFDVQVEISLSQGLAFAGTQPQAPSGTTFVSTTGIWDVGTVDVGASSELPVSVNLTSESLEDLPLEARCLTAKVVRAEPWFAYDHTKRYNDTATACLGDPPVLLTGGMISLFYPYDCVGVTTFPCTSEDTLELLAHASAEDEIDLPGYALPALIQPEKLTVQIQDLPGRQSDGTWHTGLPGVVHHLNIGGLDVPDIWTHMRREISVPDGVTLPGSFSIRPAVSLGFNFLDPVNAPGAGPFALTSAFNASQIVKFGTLGTYRVALAFLFTHKTIDADSDGNKDVFTASGTYTFHVGPIAELEVRDGDGGADLAPDGTRAFTIVAVNNGPDNAPAAQVTVPGLDADDYVSHKATAGSFDRTTGVWTIGELKTRGFQQAASGRDGEVLTIVSKAPSDTPVTAEIENTQDYRVCIDSSGNDVDAANESACTGTTGNTWHTTPYYDYKSDNNSAPT